MADLAILAKLEDNASKGLANIEGQLKGLESSATSFAAKGFANLETAMKAAAVAGAAAFAAVGAGAIKLGVDGVKAFADFQGGMNEVFTLMPGMSQDAMSQMSNDVLAFGQSIGKTSDEIIPALYQAISAGVPADNVFTFMETANAAAVGGVTDLETAVDGITSVVNAYGSEIMSAAQASDLMFTSVRLGKTDFSQLSASLFQVTPTAAALGVGFGDVTAALASLTAQGVPTSVATTQMRQMFIELSKEGGKTSATFQELAGQSFKDFIASGGNVADALEILEAHAIETGVGVNDLFGSVEAGAAALGLTGSSMEGFRANLAAMDESAGATQAAYEQMKTGMQLVFDIIGATVDNFKIRIGAALAPFVDELAPKIAAFAEQALPKLETAFKAVTEVIALFTGLGSDSIDTLDNFREVLFNIGLTSTQVDALETAVRNVAGAIKSFIANLQEGMSPMDAFLEAIWDLVPPETALALANIRDGINNFIDAVKTAIEPIASWLQENVKLQDVLAAVALVVASVVLPALASLLVAFIGFVAPIAAIILAITALRVAWENDFLGIRTAVETTFGALSSAWGEFKNAIDEGSSIFDALLSGLDELLYSMGVAPETIDKVIGSIRDVVDILTDFFGPTIERIQEAFAGLGESFSGSGEDLEALKAAFERFVPAVELVAGVIGGALALAIKLLMELFGQLLENAGQIFGGLVDVISGNLNLIVDIVEGVIALVKALIDGDWAGAWEAFTGMVENVAADVGQMLDGLFAVIDGVFGAIWDTIANFITDLGGTAVTWQEFKDNISTAFEEARTAVTTALSDALTAVTGFVSDITQAGRDIIQGLINGIEEKKQAVKDRVNEIIGSIPDAVKKLLGIQSPSTVFAAIGGYIMEGLQVGIIQGADGPVTAIRTAVGDIKLTALNEIAEMVVNISSAISPAINALNQLANFRTDPRVGQNTSEFMFYLRHLVASIVVMAYELDGARNKTLKMAQIINEIVGSVGSGITSFNQLARMSFPPSLLPNIDQFAGAVGLLTFQFAAIADQIENELIVKVQDLADSTGSLFSIISLVLDGSRALANMDFAAVVSGPYGTLANQIIIFRNIVRTLVREFAEAALELGGFADFVSKFADAADKVVGLIGEALESAAALADTNFDALVNGPYNHLATQIVIFRNIIRTLVREFAAAASDFSVDLLDSVSAFADAAGDIVGLVADALTATATLSEFDFVTAVGGMKLANNITTFRNIINTLIARFADVAAGFSEDLSKQIQDFADAAGSVLDIIEPAIDAIKVLAQEKIPALGDAVNDEGSGNLDNLAAWISAMTYKIAAVAGDMDEDLSNAVQDFADAAGAVIDLVGPAIDAITRLSSEQIPALGNAVTDEGTGNLDNLALWVNAIALKFKDVAGKLNGDAAQAVEEFSNAAGAVLQVIGPAIDGIAKIADYQGAVGLTAKVEQFGSDLYTAVSTLATKLQAIAADAEGSLTDVASFASSATTILNVVGPAIDAIDKITKYEAVKGLVERMDKFTADLDTAVRSLSTALNKLYNDIGGDVVTAANFAADVNSIFTEVSSALDGLKAIAEAKTPDTTKKMEYLVAQARIISDTLSGATSGGGLDQTTLNAAAAFATNVAFVVQQVINAMASMEALVKANTPGSLQAILDAMLAALQNTIGPVGNIGGQIGDAFGNGLLPKLKTAVESWKGGIGDILTDTRNAIGQMATAGTDMGSSFARALSLQQGAAATAGALIGDAAANALRNTLNRQSGNIAAAAQSMAKQAADAARKELQIASPSKVFTRIAEQAVAGFAQPFVRPTAATTAVRGYAGGSTSNVRQGDVYEINLTVTGNVDGASLRNIETAVQRGLNAAGRKAEARNRR